jgi:hypothetical protein
MADSDKPSDPPLDPQLSVEGNLEQVLSSRWDPGKMSALMRSSGRSKASQLDFAQRSRFETRLGTDLGHVRIYTGELAEEITRAHNAEALTIGDTGMVLMRQSTAYAPTSAAGMALLAHELTHVAQAKSDQVSRKETGGVSQDLRTGSVADTEAEAEAVEAEELERASGGSPGARASAKADKKKEKKEKVMARVLELLEEDARIASWRLGLHTL